MQKADALHPLTACKRLMGLHPLTACERLMGLHLLTACERLMVWLQVYRASFMEALVSSFSRACASGKAGALPPPTTLPGTPTGGSDATLVYTVSLAIVYFMIESSRYCCRRWRTLSARSAARFAVTSSATGTA